MDMDELEFNGESIRVKSWKSKEVTRDWLMTMLMDESI